MRYFKNRTQAGQHLAAQLGKYTDQNCAVLALSEGGIMVGAEIAKKIHASLLLLSFEDIVLPLELIPIASMSAAGTFTYNHSLSNADLEEITTEMRPIIDQSRLETFQHLNRIVSKDGELDKRLLKNHTVIIVSDGFNSGISLDVTADFLKPIKTRRIVVATPVCNTDILDKVHLLADDIYCINVVEPGFPIEHYYDDKTLPSHEEVVALMRDISLKW